MFWGEGEGCCVILIDWDFCFLGDFWERDENVSVVGLAGWLAVFVAWPIGISDRILQSC